MIVDVEQELLDWLKREFPQLADPSPDRVDWHVGLRSHGVKTVERLPFVVVYRLGGASSVLEDAPVVGFDFLGGSRAEAYDLARLVHGRLTGLAPVIVGGQVLRTVRGEVPVERPRESDDIVAWGGTYSFMVDS